MGAEIIKFDDAAETYNRDRRIMRLLLSGSNPHDIAERLGCSVTEVHNSQMRMTGGVTPDFRARQLQLDLDRLNVFQKALYEEASRGDRESIKVCLKIQDQRAKLLGLYPQPLPFDYGDRAPTSTSTDKIESLLADLKQEAMTIEGEAKEVPEKEIEIDNSDA